jgi:hypothetical protein
MTTAVCISSTRGALTYQAASYTIATSAPTSTFDFELRYNLTDQQSVALTEKDLIIFLKALVAAYEAGGTTAFFSSSPGGTNYTGPQM